VPFLVSDNTLAKFALSINLGEFIKFGTSEKKLGGAKRKSNLACAFEAILGALYLEDGNHEQAKHFLSRFIDKEIDYISKTCMN
jgi:ribonuclease-3